MRITIDTINKTIKLEEEVIIDNLLLELEKLNIDYTEYKIIPLVTNYIYPSTIINPYRPYNEPYIWHTDSTYPIYNQINNK